MTDLGYNFGDSFDTKKIKEYLQDLEETAKQEITTGNVFFWRDALSKIQELNDENNQYATIEFHKNIAKSQRKAYNAHRTDVEGLRNKVLIEADFKQKITIGLSPRQINSEYYNQMSNSRSCLGNLFFVVIIF